MRRIGRHNDRVGLARFGKGDFGVSDARNVSDADAKAPNDDDRQYGSYQRMDQRLTRRGGQRSGFLALQGTAPTARCAQLDRGFCGADYRKRSQWEQGSFVTSHFGLSRDAIAICDDHAKVGLAFA
ncbi:hypothetical protein DSM3645_13815 [Blastopirellula marina DSM 3645]|uniref:Uncharacterized protein n=1 Tax=Blastopirellula marina DSM 3645 TaxID=314230 RepID=A3ZWS1_9BACT|nr:hypothetical protein DSM3645_13815 [Blastopirellula marina DSM 3645]